MTNRNVILHGHLRKLFGESFSLNVETAGEALRALNANFPGEFIKELERGSYYIIRGDENLGMGLDEDSLNTFKLGNADLHIMPAIEGSSPRGGGKGGGGVKAILGVALIGVAIFASGGLAGGGLLAGMGQTAIPLGVMNITYGNIALFGVALTIMGASSMLSPKEKPKQETKRDDSFSFSGPINVNEQGNPVPLIYGRVIVGGQPISSGIDIEDIGTWQAGAGSGVPGYNQALINGQISPVFSGIYNSVGSS
jgi:predicted phage tail protein